MPRQFTIQIPKSQWPDFVKFLDSPVEDLRKLAELLVSAHPATDVEDLTDTCVIATGIDKSVCDAVVSIAFNLSGLQRNMEKPVADLLNLIADALEKADFPEWEQLRSQEWRTRQPILEKILSTDNAVEIMSKARELLYDFQSLLLDSAVLTDVRHIYSHDATEVKGGLVLHTLNLAFVEGMEQHQVHISLSMADVDKLLVQLQRCQSKAKVAVDMLRRLDVPNLTPKRNL